MSVQQLYDVLFSIKTDEKSGKIYVYVKENNTRRTGIISVIGGEIVSISYSRKVARAALEEMLSLPVENVILLPSSGVESADKDPDMPTSLNVLSALQNRLLDGGVVKVASLRQQVEDILKKIYGPGIVKELDRIAGSYSPEKNPRGFLDQCKLKAMLMMSKEQVEKLFGPLYKQIN